MIAKISDNHYSNRAPCIFRMFPLEFCPAVVCGMSRNPCNATCLASRRNVFVLLLWNNLEIEFHPRKHDGNRHTMNMYVSSSSLAQNPKDIIWYDKISRYDASSDPDCRSSRTLEICTGKALTNCSSTHTPSSIATIIIISLRERLYKKGWRILLELRNLNPLFSSTLAHISTDIAQNLTSSDTKDAQ